MCRSTHRESRGRLRGSQIMKCALYLIDTVRQLSKIRCCKRFSFVFILSPFVISLTKLVYLSGVVVLQLVCVANVLFRLFMPSSAPAEFASSLSRYFFDAQLQTALVAFRFPLVIIRSMSAVSAVNIQTNNHIAQLHCKSRRYYPINLVT